MTDTGYKAGQFDASWALGQPDRIVNYWTPLDQGHFGCRWYGLTPRILRPALRPSPLHHVCCSNGGRQAVMAAQRHADDWDGILAGAPAVQMDPPVRDFRGNPASACSRRRRLLSARSQAARKVQRAALAGCPRDRMFLKVSRE